MADKYCESGLYGAAVVTGTISGTVLTVSSISPGGVANVGPGAWITGAGISNYTYITGTPGTGTGGTGTYNLNKSMTVASPVTITCSHGYPRLIPSWGVAQEGDGTATGASTPATVSVDMSTWTFTSGSSTFSVMGCTALTIGAGANSATNAQYSATYATMLANIVAAINLATATTVNIPSGWTATQVRNTVYARANGNNLELMTRAGSASWNTLVALTFINVTGSSLQSWASGAGGAWGYIANFCNATIWPSAVAVCSYGLWAANRPFAGVVSAGDVITLRAGITVPWFAINSTVTMSAMGSAASPVIFAVDDGTVWPADGLTPVLTFKVDNNNNGTTERLSLSSTASVFAEILGKTYFDGTKSLHFENVGTNANAHLHIGLGGSILLSDFKLTSAVGQACLSTTVQVSAYLQAVVRDGFVSTPLSSNPFVRLSDGVATKWLLQGMVFDNTGSATPASQVLQLGLAGYTAALDFVGCKFTNFVSPSVLSAFVNVGASGALATFDACDFGNVTSRGPYIAVGATARLAPYVHAITVVNRSGNREFAIDNSRGFLEWNASGSFPTCNALLDDGVTPWSIKALPSTSAGTIDTKAPLTLPRIAKLNSLASGARTITVRFVAHSSLTPTISTVSAIVQYVSAGVIVVRDTYGNSDAAVASDSTTWANQGSYVRWALTFTTPDSIDTLTEIGVTIRLHASVSASDRLYFFDPEVGVV